MPSARPRHLRHDSGCLLTLLLCGALAHCDDDEQSAPGASDSGRTGSSTAGTSGSPAGSASSPAGAAGSTGIQGGTSGGTSEQAGGGTGGSAGSTSGDSGHSAAGASGAQPVIDCQQPPKTGIDLTPRECVDATSSCVVASDCTRKGLCGSGDSLTSFHGVVGCLEGQCHYLATWDGPCGQYAPCAVCEEGLICLGAPANHCTSPDGKTCTTSHVTCTFAGGGSHAETCVDGKVVIEGCLGSVCDPDKGCP